MGLERPVQADWTALEHALVTDREMVRIPCCAEQLTICKKKLCRLSAREIIANLFEICSNFGKFLRY